MKYIECTISGVSPLICNRFTDEAAEKATNGTAMSTVGHRGSPLEIASKKLYLGLNGKPMIPQPNLFRSIIDGGTFFKAGKSKVTTIKSSLIPACLAISQIEIPIVHTDPWTVDTRAVRIPSTGGRILAHRPCFFDWRLSFSMELDDSILSVDLLREIVDTSGKRIGLGDFRPATKGPFGRYRVDDWRVSDSPALAEAA
jgi:hypothetical protein